jgi:hypothetical protein
MATKPDRDLEAELGPSPHPAFGTRDEPWKDAELMLKLDQQHDYQYEIAHVLGTSPSQISYWMQKAKDDPEVSLVDHDDVVCEQCDGKTAGQNIICANCLDAMRRRDRQADYENYAEYLQTL